MTPEEVDFSRHVGRTVLIDIFRPIAGSICLGVSLGLFIYAFHLTRQHDRRGLPMKIMVASAVLCFICELASFSSSITGISVYLDAFIHESNYGNVTRTYEVVDAVNSILSKAMYATHFSEYLTLSISDALVIWRAQALYPDTRMIFIPTILALFASVPCLFVGYAIQGSQLPRVTYLTVVGYQLVCAGQSLSLFTNVSTTFLVGYKLWSHRRWLIRHLNEIEMGYSPVQRKILFMLETGFAFCVVQGFAVVFKLSDYPSPSAVVIGWIIDRFQFAFAANYTIILLILVQSKASVTDTMCDIADSRFRVDEPVELMEFAPRYGRHSVEVGPVIS